MEENNKNGQVNNNVGIGGVGDVQQGGVSVGGRRSSVFQRQGGLQIEEEDLERDDLEKQRSVEQQKVVSLKGVQTQKELERKKMEEATKARAVVLREQVTEAELKKQQELAKMKKQAVNIKESVGKNLANKIDVDKAENVQKKGIVTDVGLGYRDDKSVEGTIKNKKGGVDQSENKIKEDGNKTVDLRTQAERRDEVGVGKVGEKAVDNKSQNANVGPAMIITPEGNIRTDDLGNSARKPNSVVDLSNRKDNKKEMSTNEVDMGKDLKVGNEVNVTQEMVSGLSTESLAETTLEDWRQQKVDLSALSPEDRLELQATPALASVHEKMDDDTNGEVEEWFEKYNKLPVNIKLGLSAVDVKSMVEEMAKKFGVFSEEGLGEISRMVRDSYVDLIGEKEIRKRAEEKLNIGKERLAEFVDDLGKIVAAVREIGTARSRELFDQLSLEEALEKYPSLENQKITTGLIVNTKTGEELLPTVRNWLNDYIRVAGADKHTSLERIKYLTESVNVKNLPEEERKMVETLLKSYDTGEPLVIDRESQELLLQLHTDESELGLGDKPEKRVINNFKIEEAQEVDVDKLTENEKVVASEIGGLDNSEKKGIIKSEVEEKQKQQQRKNGVLDLSSEVAAKSEK